ncbi:hypothetical protein C500_10389 [Natrialba magadii ATCC 43099]|nr:hypothetical protein [Natrialba magadii]ELY30012.1 hypothetical protein C500_10389 [Natrialba magadii ATCC 43099]
MGTIAGCTDDTPEDEEEPDTADSPDSDSASADQESDGNDGADDESDSADETNDEADTETHTLELLAEEKIDHNHACLHAEFDEREPLEAGESPDTSPTEDETHVIWEVTYEGDAGYVAFDADEHEYDGPFVFYTAEGSALATTGTEVDRDTVGDDDCADLDEYVQVEPDDGQIVLELTSSS